MKRNDKLEIIEGLVAVRDMLIRLAANDPTITIKEFADVKDNLYRIINMMKKETIPRA